MLMGILRMSCPGPGLLPGLPPPAQPGYFQLPSPLPRSRAPRTQLTTYAQSPERALLEGRRGPEGRCRNRFPPSFPALALSHLPDERARREQRASGALGMFLELAPAAGPGPPHSQEPDNRTRFPFFSDVKGDHRLVLSIVETVVLALIFAVSVLGNLCALVLVARRRRRGTTACLVLNLFCADLLFASAIPPVLAVRWTEAWLLGPVACHLLFYVMSLSGSVTILTLAAVSLERMVCIVRLQRGGRGPGRRVRAALLALIWGYSAVAALPLCVFFHVVQQRLPGSDQEISVCTLIWPSVAGEISWDVLFVTVNFLVPGLLIVIGYSKILQITKASRRRLTVSMAYSESHQIRVSQQDFRLFRTLFLLMVSFFIMWSPIIITILLILIQNFKQDLVIWPSLFFWIVAFTFANSALNPILYNMSLFRNEWRKIFHCFFFSEKGAMFTDTSVRRNDLSIISN